jgi:ABC-2 type transport system ATP-binding protein
LRRRRAARELIGLAPQELAIYPTLTVRENLVFFADLHGVPRRERARRVEEVAGQLDLEPLLGRPARWLSGGEKRRLHTAIALVHRAPLLLLDEPTSGVDVATRRRLLTVVRELAERGAAVCYLTHYLGEVEELEAQIAIVDRGRMLARGTLDELVHDYGDTAVELTLEREPAATTLPAGAALDGRVLRVPTPSPDADLPALLAWAGDAGTPVASVRMLRPSLESVFLRVTGRAARDESEERQRAYAA